MITKILNLVLMSSRPREDVDAHSNHPIGFLDLLRQALKSEVSILELRLFLGAIATSVIIFSLFELQRLYIAFAQTFENQSLILALSFGGFSLLGILALYFIFRTKNPSANSEIELSEDAGLIIDPPVLLSKFIEGFLQGLRKS